MTQLRHEDCTEPDGNTDTEFGVTAHVATMEALGHCPWCGRADDAQAFEDTRR